MRFSILTCPLRVTVMSREREGVSFPQPLHDLFERLSRLTTNKLAWIYITGHLCAQDQIVTDGFLHNWYGKCVNGIPDSKIHGPTWGPPGAARTRTLLSGMALSWSNRISGLQISPIYSCVSRIQHLNGIEHELNNRWLHGCWLGNDGRWFVMVSTHVIFMR